MNCWRFQALDTWFFRESRPHDAVGGAELSSLFPPPARTVLGALRSLWGESLGIDWRAFAAAKERYSVPQLAQLDLLAALGRGNGTGALQAKGPWVCWQEQRLYPVPAFLLENTTKLYRLAIGSPVECDLGQIHLPVLKQDAAGAKPLADAWLTKEGLQQVLQGKIPAKETIYHSDRLFSRESRLGIGRNNLHRTAITGLLYQTRHLRPQAGLAVELDVDGLDPALQALLPQHASIRFGAEGRVAAVAQCQPPAFPSAPKADTTTHELILILLTDARLDQWLPDGFKPEKQDQARVWKGDLYGVELTIVAAVLGKTQREGGWDLAAGGANTAGAPRAVESLIPAGSAWYCQVSGNIKQAIQTLHGKQIGQDQALGRGVLAVGLWPKNERLTG